MAALIYIKTVTGYNFSLEVELSDTVKSVKEKIQEEKGVSSHQQRLIFTDKLLEDDKALTDYGITRYRPRYRPLRVRMDLIHRNDSN